MSNTASTPQEPSKAPKQEEPKVKPDAEAAQEEPIETKASNESGTIKVVGSDHKEKLVKAGYQMKDPALHVEIKGRTITGKDMTHKDALLILAQVPYFFKQNIVRGWYEPDSDYWK